MQRENPIFVPWTVDALKDFSFSLSSLIFDLICHCFFCWTIPISTLQATSYKTDLKNRALPGPANHIVLVGSWNSVTAQATQKNLYISATGNMNTLCQGSLHACNVRHEISVTLTPALCKGIRALVHALQCSTQVGFPPHGVLAQLPQGQPQENPCK